MLVPEKCVKSCIFSFGFEFDAVECNVCVVVTCMGRICSKSSVNFGLDVVSLRLNDTTKNNNNNKKFFCVCVCWLSLRDYIILTIETLCDNKLTGALHIYIGFDNLDLFLKVAGEFEEEKKEEEKKVKFFGFKWESAEHLFFFLYVSPDLPGTEQ